MTINENNKMKQKIRKCKFFEKRSKNINPNKFKKRLYCGISEIYKTISLTNIKFNLILLAKDIDIDNLNIETKKYYLSLLNQITPLKI